MGYCFISRYFVLIYLLLYLLLLKFFDSGNVQMVSRASVQCMREFPRPSRGFTNFCSVYLSFSGCSCIFIVVFPLVQQLPIYSVDLSRRFVSFCLIPLKASSVFCFFVFCLIFPLVSAMIL